MSALAPREAAAVQLRLREQVREEPLELARVRTVAGCDLSCSRGSDRVYVGLVVLSFPGLEPLLEVGLASRAEFPYVPGLLGFREVPPLAEAWARLPEPPDVLFCDGHGRAHPRRFGLACHAGLVLDVPVLGCAKSRLCGEAGELGPEPGDTAELRDGDELVGRVLRTRRGAKPVYISVGHRLTLGDAVALVQGCLSGYRLPEPTRLAHRLTQRLRREHEVAGSGPCGGAADVSTYR